MADELEQALRDAETALLSESDRMTLLRTAKYLSADPTVQHALDLEESIYLAAWASTAPPDTDKRERAYYALQALRGFRTRLRVLADQYVLHERRVAAQQGDVAG